MKWAGVIAIGIIILVVVIFGVPFFDIPITGIREGLFRNPGSGGGVGDLSVLDVSDDVRLTIDDIRNNPESFRDSQVTVEAPVSNWVTRSAFTVDGDLTDPGMLVISREAFDPPEEVDDVEELAMGESAQVKITGQVEEFDISRFESEWGTDLDESKLGQWQNRTVLVAEAVERL